VRWQEELQKECWRVIDSGGGRVEIIFAPRGGNKLTPIIHAFPDNQTICEEIECEEE